ncbi:MAG: hypothetical protein PHC56_10755, partial [Herbinix sp.]|nr:hypothetical protein [Herbinix sp.]
MTNNLSYHYYNIGLERARNNEITHAVDALSIAVALKDDNIPAWNLLGLCYYRLGKLPTAEYCWITSLYSSNGINVNIANGIINANNTNNANNADNANNTNNTIIADNVINADNTNSIINTNNTNNADSANCSNNNISTDSSISAVSGNVISSNVISDNAVSGNALPNITVPNNADSGSSVLDNAASDDVEVDNAALDYLRCVKEDIKFIEDRITGVKTLIADKKFKKALRVMEKDFSNGFKQKNGQHALKNFNNFGI